jgi:hypothetical protein
MYVPVKFAAMARALQIASAPASPPRLPCCTVLVVKTVQKETSAHKPCAFAVGAVKNPLTNAVAKAAVKIINIFMFILLAPALCRVFLIRR